MNKNGNDLFYNHHKSCCKYVIMLKFIVFGGGSIGDKVTSLVIHVLDRLFKHQLYFIQLFDNGLPTS